MVSVNLEDRDKDVRTTIKLILTEINFGKNKWLRIAFNEDLS